MFVFHEGLPFFLPQLNLTEKLSVNDPIMFVRSYSRFSSLVPSVRQRQAIFFPGFPSLFFSALSWRHGSFFDAFIRTNGICH